MRIDLERVRTDPFTWNIEESVAAEELGRSGLLSLGPIAWRGEVSGASGGYLLRAKAEYEQTLECTRCLVPVTLPVESEMTLFLEVVETAPLPGEHELEESDLEVLELAEPVVDTEPILREHLQLNVPLRVLCREDCAGLCPECGVNRNEVRCDCKKPADPRWEGLRELRDRFAEN